MRKRYSGTTMAVCALVTMFFVVAVPSATQAEQSCDAIVVDDAGVLSGGQDVQAAAEELNSIGADVRVRTLPSISGYATLDDLVDDTIKSCQSWQNPNGDRKSNLVVFAMSKDDRKLGIFYGDGWVNAFNDGGGEQRIWADFMVPKFKSGDFSGGFVAAIDETYRVFDNYLHPDLSPPAQPSTLVVPQEPTDYSGLWRVLGYTFGGLVLIALLVLGYFGLRQRKETNDRRRTARQRALTARDATTRITNVIGDDTKNAVRSAKVSKYSEVGKDEARQLADAESEFETEYAQAVNVMASAASDSATADDTNLSEGEYEQIAERYEEALMHAQAAQEMDQLINELTSDIEAQLRQVPSGIATAQAEFDQLAAKVNSLKEQQIKVDDIDNQLLQAEALLTEAKAKVEKLESVSLLQKANDMLTHAQTAEAELAKKRQQLDSGSSELRTRIANAKASTESARQCFDRVVAAYAAPNWESVKGNGTEAENRILAAEQALASAEELSDVSHQQWDEAISAMQEGNMLLDKAVSLLSSIIKLEGFLNDAKEHAKQEVAAVQSDIGRVTSYIDAHDDDIREVHEDAVRSAQALLDDAKQLLSENKPDYVQADKLADKAKADIDHIYSIAVDEHEAAERLRQQAAASLQKAKAAISKAQEFIEDHNSDVGSGAESTLRTAKQRLAGANQQDDAASILEAATHAIRSAEDAYQSAKRDFDDAEDDRRRAREAREAEEASRRRARESSYSSSYSSSSSSGGGSSSSWGSSSFGGGSSGSFGGSRSGGGSSGSW